jgi:hypothetical protein
MFRKLFTRAPADDAVARARRERQETRREAAIAYLRCHHIWRGELACDHDYRPGGVDWLRHKQLAVRQARAAHPSGESKVLSLLRGEA